MSRRQNSLGLCHSEEMSTLVNVFVKQEQNKFICFAGRRKRLFFNELSFRVAKVANFSVLNTLLSEK
ncbi:hypothetical protein SAMN05216357_10787 [Porphyromonadaceae bacterium KH3CP3RA]|nr:hypothetical protein SAMN05216357_10787 [Porphyromonadaceae bacterium KH3CP3RA]